jgi:hypothetical protein
LGVTLALGVIVVRLLVDARNAYRNGAAAEQRGEVTEAIRFYLEAGRLYVPGSPFTRNALDRLDALRIALVTKGDYPTARMAFEAERAALLGTRSFYTPYAARLPGLDRRIFRLLAAAEENSAQTTFKERAQWHAERIPGQIGPILGLPSFGVAWGLRLIALIKSEDIAKKILIAMHLPVDIPQLRPAHPPPQKAGGDD